MKKPRSDTKPPVPPVTPEMKGTGLENLHFLSDELPTPGQIAVIAAMLARNSNDKPDTLADAAMNLWLESWARIRTADYNFELDFRQSKLEEDLGIHTEPFLFEPTGDKYPVPRDAFLLKVFPKYKSRTADLAAIAKAFLRFTLCDAKRREPTLVEVAEAYEKWKPCNNYREANQLADRVYQWRNKHIRESRRAAGLRSAAQKGAAKKVKKML